MWKRLWITAALATISSTVVSTAQIGNVPLPIMPLGDSITHGAQIPGGYRITLSNNIVTNGINATFVGSQFQDDAPNELISKWHEGHLGWIISQIDTNVDGFLDQNAAQIILLMIGTNDVYDSIDLDTAPDRLRALIDRINLHSPTSNLIVSSITPLADDVRDQLAVTFNSSIPGIVEQKIAQGKPVRFVEMHSALIRPDDLNADGVHPNAVGYTKMAGVWWDALLYTLGCDAMTLTPSPSSQSFPQAGGMGTIAVAGPTTCLWFASSSVSWMSITAGASGSGNGAIRFSVAANNSPTPRIGYIAINGRRIPFIQKGTNTALPFPVDVPASHPFVDYITLFSANGITSGCGPGRFCPDSPTTRGQMAVFIIRAKLGEPTDYSPTPWFDDVPASHPYFKYIQKMRDLNITTGCAPNLYCPDATVTRGQMAVFIIRAKLGDLFTFAPTPFFSDAPPLGGFFRHIQKMREFGITTGCGATTYCSSQPVTRGQMAVFIIRGDLRLP